MAASTSRERLQALYEEWLVRQQDVLDELLAVSSEIAGDPRRKAVIERAVSHYQKYFNDRNLIAGDDVFVVFAAPWLSALEQTYQWVGGIKPALIIRLVESGAGLTEAQAGPLESLKAETGRSQWEVAEALAAVQESVAATPLVTVLQRLGTVGGVDGQITVLDTGMERLRRGMERVLESADTLRGATMRRAMELLQPAQVVGFLVAAARFQLRLRQWGVERDTSQA